ncbi:hypothetical protein B7463_g11620, partial [Scytalidium lignicola]
MGDQGISFPMMIALITCPALLATSEAIRQGQQKDRKEEHRARRCNLIVRCLKPSKKSLEIDHRYVVLKDSKLYIDTGLGGETLFGHPFMGYYLPYPDSQYEGLVSTITDEAPIMNWIYADRETYEVKYGVRNDAQPNVTGPFDCTRQDHRLTLEGWEGFVAVEEEGGLVRINPHHDLPPSVGMSGIPSALRNPENVKRIIVVAFGAFDRYYVCWEDQHGQYQQDSNKLPERLNQWLFPPDGGTRDFLTLQVSLGHNDEYFAFDKFGKLSSRDPVVRNQKPRDERDMGLRKKSYTFSESTTSADVFDRLQHVLDKPRFQRPMSLAIAGPTGRGSWRERQTFLNRHERQRSLGDPRLFKIRTGYVDTGVQTEALIEEEDEFSGGVRYQTSSFIVHPSPSRSMGLMQDYFREQQYQLGDVLQGI